MTRHHAPPGAEISRFFRLSRFFQERLGGRARKVPLDAGLSWPIVVFYLSRSGCVFCIHAGSGTGLHAAGVPLEDQWAGLAGRVLAKYPTSLLVAYLQAYTNTHCEPEVLRALIHRISALPGVSGLCLGTRPDCLDVDQPSSGGPSRLDILAQAGLRFVQLDLGLQSADDAVLQGINRGHDVACFARAVRAAAQRGIHVCAHVVDGLPGAAADDLLRSVAFLNELPVSGIKFHNALVCRGTALAALWRAGRYAPPDLDGYAARVAGAIALLRPDICVQRLAADPSPGELLAPGWAADKNLTQRRIEAELVRQDVWQGQALGGRGGEAS